MLPPTLLQASHAQGHSLNALNVLLQLVCVIATKRMLVSHAAPLCEAHTTLPSCMHGNRLLSSETQDPAHGWCAVNARHTCNTFISALLFVPSTYT
jgi:hypothetical protein